MTEWVREGESGDSEDDEDDELPCMTGESEGDCVWRGSRRSVGNSFHRQGAAYQKARLVTFKEKKNKAKNYIVCLHSHLPLHNVEQTDK